MKRAEFIKELDSRLKDAGWLDDLDVTSDDSSSDLRDSIRDECDTLVTDVEDGDWDDEEPAE